VKKGDGRKNKKKKKRGQSRLIRVGTKKKESREFIGDGGRINGRECERNEEKVGMCVKGGVGGGEGVRVRVRVGEGTSTGV
jgi:hypothetical protein